MWRIVTAHPSTPVFDHTLLLTNLGGDLELAAELAELYQIEGFELLKQLKHAIKRQDVEATLRLAHSLKGASANVTASQLQHNCQQLEDVAHQGNWEAVRIAWAPVPEQFYHFSNHVAGIFSLPPLNCSVSAFVAEHSL